DRTVNGVGASFHQFLVQAGGVILVAAYSFIITLLILKVLSMLTQIRPSDTVIAKGLDQQLLDETSYDLSVKGGK
ncbi:hypothetical protein ACKI2C_48455, partial [Streptomyces brasiliscabiei]